MKENKRVLLFLAFVLGIITGIILMTLMVRFPVQGSISSLQKFTKVYEMEDVRIGITVNENLYPAIKETIEALTEHFTYHLAGAIKACEVKQSLKPLDRMIDALERIAKEAIEELEREMSGKQRKVIKKSTA